jgi:hypothetical protein
MYGEVVLSALQLQKGSKVVASVLATMIRVKLFDVHPMLGACPCCKQFVSIEGLILGVKQVELSKVGVIVSERDVVFAATQTRDKRGAPNVEVYLVTKGLSQE